MFFFFFFFFFFFGGGGGVISFMKANPTKFQAIDSFHIVSAHAPNCLVPRDLREKTR